MSDTLKKDGKDTLKFNIEVKWSNLVNRSKELSARRSA